MTAQALPPAGDPPKRFPVVTAPSRAAVVAAIGLLLVAVLGAILAMPVTAMARDVFRFVFDRASGSPQPIVEDDGGTVVAAVAGD